MIDRWEEAFDTWMPRSGTASDETSDVEVDREELLRLARELAARRQVDQEHSRVELEQLKESLRERAAAVAARERELLDFQRQLERKGKPASKPTPDTDALAARERAVHERLQAAEARERELAARAAELEEESARLAEQDASLRSELDAAREELNRSASDRELAAAERERLEERLEAARRTEKELAATRLELEQERERIEARERDVLARAAATASPEDTQPDPYEEREGELRRLESRLEARERELALLRQGLDAQRIELRDRERSVRRRDAAEARQTFEPPHAPPSFSEGLSSFVNARSRS